MTISQKRAIWYKIQAKKKEAQIKYLIDNGLFTEYMESRYKTMTWFLKSKGIYNL